MVHWPTVGAGGAGATGGEADKLLAPAADELCVSAYLFI